MAVRSWFVGHQLFTRMYKCRVPFPEVSEQSRRVRRSVTTGATPSSEKLEGTSRGVDVDTLHFPPPSLPLLLHAPMFHPLPSLIFPSPVKFTKEVSV